jgi:hypothetical protein
MAHGICAGGRNSGVTSTLRSLALVATCACSSSGGEEVLPYPVGQVMVFGESPAGAMARAMGSTCTSEPCAAVQERCGLEAYAEVILGTALEVLDVICYRADLGVRQLEETPFDVIGEENDTVFIFDAIDDGADLLDEVTVSGENDVLYGTGADVSVLGAGLTIDGPNTIVRGLTIRGGVTIDRDDAKLSLVEIWGDLTINGNQMTLSESIVHGDVRVVGTNAVLARNLLEGATRLIGTNLECALNQRFDDRNGNREIERNELRGEVDCQ